MPQAKLVVESILRSFRDTAIGGKNKQEYRKRERERERERDGQTDRVIAIQNLGRDMLNASDAYL